MSSRPLLLHTDTAMARFSGSVRTPTLSMALSMALPKMVYTSTSSRKDSRRPSAMQVMVIWWAPQYRLFSVRTVSSTRLPVSSVES